jgi:hypothetical protein
MVDVFAYMRHKTGAISQDEHRAINAREYPGTRQLCASCGDPTERCEEDGMWLDDGRGPFCEWCFHEAEESRR